jgi:predicted nucleotidyltransferase
MENAQTLNPVFARHNEDLERENAELRDNVKMLKQRQKDFGDAFLELFGSRLDAHFENALSDFDVMQEVNNNITDLDTSGLDIDLWDHEDEIRDILNSILKNRTIKLELY